MSVRVFTLTEAVELAEQSIGVYRTSADGSPEWAGGTWREAKRLATHGWTDGARRAAEVATRIADRVVSSPSLVSTHEELGYDVTGGCYDHGAYAQGVPECWLTMRPVEARRAVRIVVNIAASGGVSNEILERRGFATVAMALTFDAMGYPVTVDVCDVQNYVDHDFVIRVADSSTGSPLDVDRLAYALAHPTSLRQVVARLTNQLVGRSGAWDRGIPWREAIPEEKVGGAYDVGITGGHLKDVEKWTDGGESWVVEQYLNQTSGV